MSPPWKPTRPRAVLLASGPVPDLSFLKGINRTETHIIAVDGGAAVLQQLGITPCSVMGDGDGAAGITNNFVHLPDQYKSDLEKSIAYLLDGGVRQFTIYGALGGARVDHTIANLDLLAKFAPRCRMDMVDECGTHVMALSAETMPPGGMEFHVREGSVLSTLPYAAPAIITLRGTRYDVQEQSIMPGTHGVGNTALSPTVHLRVHSGIIRFTFSPA